MMTKSSDERELQKLLQMLALMRIFPGLWLSRYFKITSDETGTYNCIAWAAGDTTKWWDPQNHWPDKVNKGMKIDDLIDAYKTEGFSVCDDGTYEENVQKIALYEKDGRWTHAAKQLNKDSWSSKLGESFDISHDKPDDLGGGGQYGSVVRYMAKAS